MADADAFKKGWFAALKIDRDEDAKKTQRFVGRFGLARKKKLEDAISKNKNYLTPPARRNAIVWQRQVFRLLRGIPKRRELSLTRLTDIVFRAAIKERKPLSVSALTLRRFINQLGYLDRPGRQKR